MLYGYLYAERIGGNDSRSLGISFTILRKASTRHDPPCADDQRGHVLILTLYDVVSDRLMHRGMPNVSEGTQRDIMQFVYHASWYTERKNYGTESLLS